MDSSEDKLFEYFIAMTNARLQHIEDKVDRLLAFRNLLLGISVAVSVAISSIFGLVEIYFMHK